MKTSDLQSVLATMETLTDELCDTDHNWEWNVKVKRSIMLSNGHYTETLRKKEKNIEETKEGRKKEWKKEEISTVSTAWLLPNKGRSTTRYVSKSKISALLHGQKKINAGALEWHLKNVQSGLWTYRSECTKLIFLHSSHTNKCTIY